MIYSIVSGTGILVKSDSTSYNTSSSSCNIGLSAIILGKSSVSLITYSLHANGERYLVFIHYYYYSFIYFIIVLLIIVALYCLCYHMPLLPYIYHHIFIYFFIFFWSPVSVISYKHVVDIRQIADVRKRLQVRPVGSVFTLSGPLKGWQPQPRTNSAAPV